MARHGAGCVAAAVPRVSFLSVGLGLVQVAKSEEFKTKANTCFADNQIKEAISLYISALELNPSNHILYANRAFCHIKLENYGSAILDASEAIRRDPSYIKGYYRRGTANLALGKLKQAKWDFREACKIEPGNKEARSKLADCDKAMKKERFEMAQLAEMVAGPGQDPDLVEVEASYAGPHTDDGVITQAFVEEMLLWQKAEKRLHKKYALQILIQARNVLKAEKPVVDISVPEGKHVTVCGDVHGQYYDLLNIFELNGKPSETNPYLFNGDFVDRGSFSIEVMLALFAYKCLYPKHLHLNRGNHESVNMNKLYGFEGEVASKYSKEMMGLFTDTFQWLPLAHVIGGKVLVLHGGLFSKAETSLDDLRQINRHQEPPGSSRLLLAPQADITSLPLLVAALCCLLPAQLSCRAAKL
jgi:serine/threonine-protein phosphatase 5